MRIKKFPKFTKILFVWEDITQDAAWHEPAERDKKSTAVVRTMGFYLDTKQRKLRVAHSIADDGDSDIMCIPWGVIRSIKELATKE
jgi:hypothetical protein